MIFLFCSVRVFSFIFVFGRFTAKKMPWFSLRGLMATSISLTTPFSAQVTNSLTADVPPQLSAGFSALPSAPLLGFINHRDFIHIRVRFSILSHKSIYFLHSEHLTWLTWWQVIISHCTWISHSLLNVFLSGGLWCYRPSIFGCWRSIRWIERIIPHDLWFMYTLWAFHGLSCATGPPALSSLAAFRGCQSFLFRLRQSGQAICIVISSDEFYRI